MLRPVAADCAFCGVQAIGSCQTCGRAFCMTHQGRGTDGGRLATAVRFTNACQQCSDAVDRQHEPPGLGIANRWKFLESIPRCVDTLVRAGAPTQIHSWSQTVTRTETIRRSFGRKDMYRQVEEVRSGTTKPCFPGGWIMATGWGEWESSRYTKWQAISVDLRVYQFQLFGDSPDWDSNPSLRLNSAPDEKKLADFVSDTQAATKLIDGLARFAHRQGIELR
jgi:hypothetical protein